VRYLVEQRSLIAFLVCETFCSPRSYLVERFLSAAIPELKKRLLRVEASFFLSLTE
jgi:hypothetical protein